MKIHVAFISKPQWEGGHPYIGYDNEQLKNFIFDILRRKFPNVEFTGGEVIVKYDKSEMEKIKEEVKKADGLFVYTIGQYGDPGIVNAGVDLVKLGIPTILANYIYGGDTTFIQIYSRVKDRGLRVLPISSPDFKEVEWAIGVLSKVLDLRGKKILNYTLNAIKWNLEGQIEMIKPMLKEPTKKEEEFLTKAQEALTVTRELYIDLVGTDQAHQWRRDEEKYKKNLAEVFGLEMIRPDPEEIWKLYQETDEKEAKEVADRWIKDADKVESRYEAIVNSAKLYLAMKKLVEKCNADAITVDCGTLMYTGYLPAMPCMAFHQLWNEGSTGICESDMDCTVSALLGRYLTGRPGFTSNHSFDLANNRITYFHCMISNRLYGPDGPSQNYEILPHGEAHILGAAIWLNFPVGENVTTVKVSMLEKKIAIRSGRIITSIRDEKACTNKMLVETNARKILENYDFKTFGWHRVSLIGDWRKDFIAAARLLGLEVVEEDK